MELAPLVYKILFGDEPVSIPDPNKPENIPRLKAMQTAREDKFKRFWDGEGSVLIERWQEKIRDNMFELLVEETDCNCKTCNKIREVATVIKMLSEAKIILTKE